MFTYTVKYKQVYIFTIQSLILQNVLVFTHEIKQGPTLFDYADQGKTLLVKKKTLTDRTEGQHEISAQYPNSVCLQTLFVM